MKVQLFTRAGCCLCDEAHESIERVRAETPFELEIIDIDTDPTLVERYGWEIPVVLVDGKKIAKLHLDEAMLRRRVGA